MSFDCSPGDADFLGDVVHIGFAVKALGLRLGFVFGMVVVVEESAEFPDGGLGFFVKAKGLLVVDFKAESVGDGLGHALGVFGLGGVFLVFFSDTLVGWFGQGLGNLGKDRVLCAWFAGVDKADLKDAIMADFVVGSELWGMLFAPAVGLV